MRSIHAFRFSLFLCLAAGLIGVRDARATVVGVTVGSQAAPWLWADGGLNTAYQYGTQDSAAPAVVSTANGLDFSVGGSLTVTYLSGLTSPYGGDPYADADGDTSYDANDNSGSSGNFFSSLYIPSSSYPVYLAALVGTFTDASGAIVGTPFLLGNGPTTITIPAGATQLQLGINDDIFSDNTGELNLSVSDGRLSAVPEPSTLAGLAIGLVGIAARLRRRAGR